MDLWFLIWLLWPFTKNLTSGLVWFWMTWMIRWIPRVQRQCERPRRENMPFELINVFVPWEMCRDEIINFPMGPPPNLLAIREGLGV